jgi:hypothetical protein
VSCSSSAGDLPLIGSTEHLPLVTDLHCHIIFNWVMSVGVTVLIGSTVSTKLYGKEDSPNFSRHPACVHVTHAHETLQTQRTVQLYSTCTYLSSFCSHRPFFPNSHVHPRRSTSSSCQPQPPRTFPFFLRLLVAIPLDPSANCNEECQSLLWIDK